VNESPFSSMNDSDPLAGLTSGVYRPKRSAAGSGEVEIDDILRGASDFLASLEVSTVTIGPGAAFVPSGPAGGNETFFIVLAGGIEASVGGRGRRLGPRGVAQFMPGTAWSVRNAEANPAAILWMRYDSRRPAAGVGEARLVDGGDPVGVEHDRGKLWRYFDGPSAMTKRFEVHVTALNAGIESHEPHRHPPEEIVLLLEGEAIVTFGTTKREARAGDLAFWRSDEPHALENKGVTPCVYFALQWE